jgi:hypothetical protein
LIGHRRNLDRHCDVIVITTATKVDHVTVVRILQDANEVALAEALAVTPKQLERLLADAARRNGTIARREDRDRTRDEAKRFLAR